VKRERIKIKGNRPMRSKIGAALTLAILGMSAPSPLAAGGGKCLIFNLKAMEAKSIDKLMDLVPLMTLGGKLENAGSASHPVLCFEYGAPEDAASMLEQMRDVYEAADLAKIAKVSGSCSDD
jgi:hypothetical protein